MKNNIYNDEHVVLWMLLYRTRHILFRARQMELAPYDISPSQALILIIIMNFGGKVTLSKIRRHIYREPHSVSEQITRMEKRGLVRKVRNATNSANFKIELTQDGKKLYKQVVKQEVIHNIMSVLTKKQSQQLTLCLNRLLEKGLRECGLHMLPLDEQMSLVFSKSGERDSA